MSSSSTSSSQEEPIVAVVVAALKSKSKSKSTSSYSSSDEDGVPAILQKPAEMKPRPIVYFFAFIAALSGLCFGYDIGGSGGTFVMPSFRQFFGWDVYCSYLDVVDGKSYDDEYYRPYGVEWPENLDPKTDKSSGFTCAQFYEGGLLDENVTVDYTWTEYTRDMQKEPCKSCCCDSPSHAPGATDGTEDPEASESGDITLYETLGCFFGAIVSPFAADYLGRRIALMISCSTFTLGALIQTCTPASNAYPVMIAGRVIGGLGIGMMSMHATLYQGEIAPESIRGFLVTMQQLCIVTGIVSASLINLGLQQTDIGWRFSYGGNIFLSVPMFVLLFFAPESPVWLMQKGREEEAMVALKRIRHPEEVEYEMSCMRADLARQRIIALATKVSWTELFTKKYRNNLRLFTVVALHVIQQLTGINAIMFFGPTIVTIIFGVGIGQYGGLIFNTVNFFATFICVYAIDRWGRMPLMLSGTCLCFFGQLLAAILASPLETREVQIPGTDDFIEEWLYEYDSGVGWGIIIGICIFIVGFAYSWGPIAWVYGSEALNLRTKSIGMAIAVAANWGTACIIAKLFPIMNKRENMGIHGSFYFFSSWLAVGMLVLVFFIPETSGVPLDRMDEMWAQTKIEFLGPKIKPWTPPAEKTIIAHV